MTTMTIQEFNGYKNRLKTFFLSLKSESCNSTIPVASKKGVQLLKSAGILTKSGNISKRYKPK